MFSDAWVVFVQRSIQFNWVGIFNATQSFRTIGITIILVIIRLLIGD